MQTIRTNLLTKHFGTTIANDDISIHVGTFFPWAIPALYSGAGGEYKAALNEVSYLILIMTSLAGYFVTIGYWKIADQTK